MEIGIVCAVEEAELCILVMLYMGGGGGGGGGGGFESYVAARRNP